METSLHVEDLERSRAFYHRVFGLETALEDEQVIGMEMPGRGILLFFADGVVTGGHLTRHLCFSIPLSSVPEWERHLMLSGVAIESRVLQRNGSTSLYFRDPDGHSLEVATQV